MEERTLHLRRPRRASTGAPALLFCLLVWSCGTPDPPSTPPSDSPGAPPSQQQPSPQESSNKEPALLPTEPFERPLVGGEKHLYRIDLEEGHFLHLQVEQLGIDIVVRLVNPAGTLLLEVDSPTGKEGSEELFAVAPSTALYTLELEAWPGVAHPGRYRVNVLALRPAQTEDLHRAKAVRHLSAGRKAQRREDWSAARRELKAALGGYRALGDDLGEMRAGRRLGDVLSQGFKDREAALQAFREALEPANRLRDADQLGTLWHEIGWLQQQNLASPAAVESFLQALEFRRRAGDLAGEAKTLNSLGLEYRRQGAVQAAEDHYDRALALWRELKQPREVALTLHNLGSLYRAHGYQEQARDHLESALILRQELLDGPGQASTLNALGSVYERQGEHRLALDAYERALARRDHDRGRAISLNGIASALRELGQDAAARRAFEQALGIFETRGDRYDQAVVLLNLGRLDFTQQPRKAQHALQQALALFELVGEPLDLAAAHFLLAHTERALDRPGVALERIETAVELLEATHATSANDDQLSMALFADKGAYFDFWIDLLMDLEGAEPEAGHGAEALAVSERSRARTLLDRLTRRDLRALDPKLLEADKELVRRLQQLGQERLDHPKTPRKELDQRLRSLLREHQKLRARLPSAPHSRGFTHPLNTAQMRRLLDPFTLLLFYHLGTDNAFLWVLDQHTLSSIELGSRQHIEDLAREAHRLLPTSHRWHGAGRLRQVLEALSERILAPVVDHLGTHPQAHRLAIVADGALQYIPFAALPIPAGLDSQAADQDFVPLLYARPPLVAGFELINLPSASSLHALRERRRGRAPPASTLALIADPVYSCGDPRILRPPQNTAQVETPGDPTQLSTTTPVYQRLLFAGREVEALEALVPAEERWTAQGFAATRELVTSDVLAGYDLVHFATHGNASEDFPELAHLALSQVDRSCGQREGLLYAHDIEKLRLNARLVVLSACQTGLGRNIRGEGLVGLTRAFLNAGTDAVLVSLWEVDDLATAELMTRLYRNLLEDGLAPAIALRRAQIALATQNPWRAPFFWAAFTLQGSWGHDPK